MAEPVPSRWELMVLHPVKDEARNRMDYEVGAWCSTIVYEWALLHLEGSNVGEDL